MEHNWNQYRYLLLGTRRRSGVIVDTPVWFAVSEQRLYAFSNADAGKVKRLRNHHKVRIAPCTVRGRPLGESVAAQAELLSEASAMRTAHNALRARYGWQMWLLDKGAALTGRDQQRAWIAIDLMAPETV